MKLILNTDGGSRGNPGPAAYGFAVHEITPGAVKLLEKCGNYIGETTNNQAEYAALIAGLTWITTHHPTAEVQIFMDSLLIVNQVKGEYKVKNADLIPKYREAVSLISRLPTHSISYIPREQNALADAMVNLALDAHQS